MRDFLYLLFIALYLLVAFIWKVIKFAFVVFMCGIAVMCVVMLYKNVMGVYK